MEKILFLDSDIYINRNIEEIWKEFHEQYSIVAVSDPGYHDEDALIGIKKTEDTFNSGVKLFMPDICLVSISKTCFFNS
ncbi:MAG: hypothetical protein EGQ23_03750, partial [Solobacterium sp.]|nr:hypothetical protein [Solobacterium sp.]